MRPTTFTLTLISDQVLRKNPKTLQNIKTDHFRPLFIQQSSSDCADQVDRADRADIILKSF